MTPDMMPRVGPGKRPGVFYNTGHGHLGWTLSAATAQPGGQRRRTAAASLRRRGLAARAHRLSPCASAPVGASPARRSRSARVGPGKRPGVFYNTGHGHLGWTLSAATAQRWRPASANGCGLTDETTGLAARSSPPVALRCASGASPARRSRSRSAAWRPPRTGRPRRRSTFIQPIMKGVAKPARLPTELMKAMPPAAAVPVKKPAGIAQNTGNAPNTPMRIRSARPWPAPGCRCRRRSARAPPRRPAWRRRNAGAARRSCRSARH